MIFNLSKKKLLYVLIASHFYYFCAFSFLVGSFSFLLVWILDLKLSNFVYSLGVMYKVDSLHIKGTK